MATACEWRSPRSSTQTIPKSRAARHPSITGTTTPAVGRAWERRSVAATSRVAAAPLATPAASLSVHGLLDSLTTSATASMTSSYFFSVSRTRGPRISRVPFFTPWAANVSPGSIVAPLDMVRTKPWMALLGVTVRKRRAMLGRSSATGRLDGRRRSAFLSSCTSVVRTKASDGVSGMAHSIRSRAGWRRRGRRAEGPRPSERHGIPPVRTRVTTPMPQRANGRDHVQQKLWRMSPIRVNARDLRPRLMGMLATRTTSARTVIVPNAM